MSDYADGAAFSDISFVGKFLFLVSWLFKSLVLFSIFSVFAVLKQFIVSIGVDPMYTMLIVSVAVIAYSIAFLIFYIISEGVIKKMFLGIVISIIGAVVTAIFPPLGILIGIIGIISMISQIISFVKMIPMLLFGFLVALLLFSDVIFLAFDLTPKNISFLQNMSVSILGFHFAFPKIMLGYFAVSALASLTLAFKYSLKNAMMRQVVIFMAIPITALVVWLIKTVLSNALYRPGEIQQVSVNRGKVFVHGFYRANGTFVNGYWRSFPKI